MARTPPKKSPAGTPKKTPAPRKSGAAAFNVAMQAVGGTGVPNHEIGRLNKDGTHTIDSERVEELKKRLGKEAWSKVRFVAMNAPFKRRAQNPPA